MGPWTFQSTLCAGLAGKEHGNLFLSGYSKLSVSISVLAFLPVGVKPINAAEGFL